MWGENINADFSRGKELVLLGYQEKGDVFISYLLALCYYNVNYETCEEICLIFKGCE